MGVRGIVEGMLTVHYFAAARAAAGVASEQVEAPATLGDLVAQLSEEHTGTTEAGMSLKESWGAVAFLSTAPGTPPWIPRWLVLPGWTSCRRLRAASRAAAAG